MSDRLKIAVLISGSGSNLQAIIDAIQKDNIPCDIQLVVSNQALAYGLKRAEYANLKTKIIDHTSFPDRLTFDQAIGDAIDRAGAELVVLAGFMRIFSHWFVNRYRNKLINIHPSLLPKFKGLDTHVRTLSEGETHHGASVHLVTPELDTGPNILQGRITVHSNDTPESLQNRVHQIEHRIYPTVIQWLATHRLVINESSMVLDHQPLTTNGKVIDYEDI